MSDLFRAAHRGDVTAIVAAVAGGASVNVRNSDGWTPLMVAVLSEHETAVRVLLQLGADAEAVCNVPYASPFSLAAQKRNARILNMLLGTPSRYPFAAQEPVGVREPTYMERLSPERIAAAMRRIADADDDEYADDDDDDDEYADDDDDDDDDDDGDEEPDAASSSAAGQ